MAALQTTVHSPVGPILRLTGRVPGPEIKSEAAKRLRQQIRDAEAHLAEIDNWYHDTTRNGVRALTAEEMNSGRPKN